MALTVRGSRSLPIHPQLRLQEGLWSSEWWRCPVFRRISRMLDTVVGQERERGTGACKSCGKSCHSATGDWFWSSSMWRILWRRSILEVHEPSVELEWGPGACKSSVVILLRWTSWFWSSLLDVENLVKCSIDSGRSRIWRGASRDFWILEVLSSCPSAAVNYGLRRTRHSLSERCSCGAGIVWLWDFGCVGAELSSR